MYFCWLSKKGFNTKQCILITFTIRLLSDKKKKPHLKIIHWIDLNVIVAELKKNTRVGNHFTSPLLFQSLAVKNNTNTFCLWWVTGSKRLWKNRLGIIGLSDADTAGNWALSLLSVRTTGSLPSLPSFILCQPDTIQMTEMGFYWLPPQSSPFLHPSTGWFYEPWPY